MLYRLGGLKQHPRVGDYDNRSSGYIVVRHLCWLRFILRNPLYCSEGGIFKARMSFPPDFPLNPPKLKFVTPMWHPNSMFYILTTLLNI